MNTEILETLQLQKGNHESADSGMCAMEAAAYIAGEKFSDSPQCVDLTIAAFMRRLNDRLNDEDRQALKPYVLKVIGTRSTTAVQIKRAYLAVDWSIRVFTPTWLELAGMSDEAKMLRELDEVTRETVESVRDLVRGIRNKAQDKRTKARKKLENKYAATAAADAYADAADAAADAYADAADAAAAAAATATAATAYATATAAAATADAAADAYAYAAAAAYAAATAAYATAAADAYAATADAATAAYATAAAATKGETYQQVYDEVYARCEKALEPTAKRMLPMALELLDRMIAVQG